MNKNNLWFKRKLYGWGWTPSTWQGWTVVALYFIFVVIVSLVTGEPATGDPDSGSNFLVRGLPVFLATIILILIAYKKGEKPRWQWGKDNDDTK